MKFIYSHFISLDETKQSRILNAAYREFGRFGYQKTSVKQIAVSAGIAKGMVFHYFGSKLGLFEYLFQNTEEFLQKWWGDLEDELSQLDYIEQYRFITKIKLQAYKENPFIFEFMAVIFTHPENLEVSDKAKQVYEGIWRMRSNIFALMEETGKTDRFKEGFDVEQVKKYIGWILDGYSNHLLSILNNGSLADKEWEPYWEEFDGILNDCKKLFYNPQ